MGKDYFAKKIFVLGIVFFIFHFFAVIFHIYWIVPWSDVISHILGGIIVSLIFWHTVFSKRLGIISRYQRFFTLFGAMFLGIIWEIFEIVFQISVLSSRSYWQSTFIDMLATITGAFMGYYYYVNLKSKA